MGEKGERLGDRPLTALTLTALEVANLTRLNSFRYLTTYKNWPPFIVSLHHVFDRQKGGQRRTLYELGLKTIIEILSNVQLKLENI